VEIIPAIDLKAGKCVRLYQGDFSRETVFSEDPVAVALSWQSQGAPRLHIVDLDGAAKGELVNKELIGTIVKSVSIPVQVGGGIRKLATIGELIGLGAKRVILGTVAVEEMEMVTEACRKFGEAIIVSIDAKDGYVVTHGWQKLTQITALELAGKLKEMRVRRLIYTDIKRDGTLTEPNFSAIAELVANAGLPIIASGGVSSLAHLEKLRKLKVEGVIIGRALYTGDIKLREALKVSKER
jgi:phosphoribosylformimino-5-aminoimidazole carboxamide ribotide isomerase